MIFLGPIVGRTGITERVILQHRGVPFDDKSQNADDLSASA
jgi:hypothetical protein